MPRKSGSCDSYLDLKRAVLRRQTGGEPYAVKAARTVRWGEHLPSRDLTRVSIRPLEVLERFVPPSWRGVFTQPQANLILFFLGPILTLVFSLLGYAVIPYGPGLAISDYNLGILYMLAVSSLATYGILLAGWSANSKYAFLGSQWPNKDVSLYLKQTISEKFIKQILLTLLFLLTLLDTLCVTPCAPSNFPFSLTHVTCLGNVLFLISGFYSCSNK